MSAGVTDIRIPLFIKGPGIAPGTKLQQMVANIDVSPTLLELAGLQVPPIMDGQSLVPALMSGGKPGKDWRTRFASEFAEGGDQNYGIFRGAQGLYDNPDNQWRMLRVINATHNIAYIEWDREYIFNTIQFREYYDIAKDPWQQTNLWNSTAGDIQGSLHAELVNLFTCTGTRTEVSSCHARSSSPLQPPAPAPAPVPSPPPPGPSGHTCRYGSWITITTD
jgi:N-acetylglucosamine-6-sulfatase